MTTRDTRRNFLRLLDDTWPGVQSEFVAAMRQARAGVDMRARYTILVTTICLPCADRGVVSVVRAALNINEPAR